MQCQSCRKEVSIDGRVAFRDECPHCGTDLHSCRHCRFHNRGVYNECREPSAEQVSDKEKANRCEYFGPASQAGPASADDARAKLEALFKK